MGTGGRPGQADADSLGLVSHRSPCPFHFPLSRGQSSVGWGVPLNDHLCFSFFALGLWNLVFLFSNLSLIFLMPFAYFFTESEGFAGSRKVSRGMYQSIQCRPETVFH